MGNIKALESTFLSDDDNYENDDSDNDNDDNYDNDKYGDDDAKPGSNKGRIQVAWDTAGWSRGWRRRERGGCWRAESPDIFKLPKRRTDWTFENTRGEKFKVFVGSTC